MQKEKDGGNIEAHTNAFTKEEMVAIYMALHESNLTAKEYLNEFILRKNLTLEEKQEIYDIKNVNNHIISTKKKVEKILHNAGIDAKMN